MCSCVDLQMFTKVQNWRSVSVFGDKLIEDIGYFRVTKVSRGVTQNEFLYFIIVGFLSVQLSPPVVL